MNARTKNILKASLNEFKGATIKNKENMVHHVQRKCKVNINALK